MREQISPENRLILSHLRGTVIHDIQTKIFEFWCNVVLKFVLALRMYSTVVETSHGIDMRP